MKGEEFIFTTLKAKMLQGIILGYNWSLPTPLHASSPVSQQKILRWLQCGYIKVHACSHEGRQPA